jgi:glucose-1-phosphate adenylyltransferase
VQKTLGIILAGGQGSRLAPLTQSRAKPAVPFGKYRIIDFVLANFFNSGIRDMIVVTQYAPMSLSEHVQSCWQPMIGFGDSLVVASPQMRHEEEFKYLGTADAVWRNRELITKRRYDPEQIAIFCGDHIYMMDISQVVRYHIDKRSEFTVCVDVVPVRVAAGALGVLRVDTANRILEFLEKPLLENIPEIPGRKGFCYASMGNYIAHTKVLWEVLENNAVNTDSSHDFGKDIIPLLHRAGKKMYAYPLHLNEIEGQNETYWRDVGTLSAYYMSVLGMLEYVPALNLENPAWPIPSRPDYLPSARILGGNARVIHGAMSGGVVIDDALVAWSMIGRSVRVKKRAEVKDSIVFDNVEVGEGARLQRVICDKCVRIPPGTSIGYSREEDVSRGFHVEALGDACEWLTIVPEHCEFS